MCNKTESVLPFFFVQRELRILKLRLILCGSFFFNLGSRERHHVFHAQSDYR